MWGNKANNAIVISVTDLGGNNIEKYENITFKWHNLITYIRFIQIKLNNTKEKYVE